MSLNYNELKKFPFVLEENYGQWIGHETLFKQKRRIPSNGHWCIIRLRENKPYRWHIMFCHTFRHYMDLIQSELYSDASAQSCDISKPF